ncbi:hydrolase [Azospirillum picis]|uniref:Nicotinamidase-related amidase n=1 Tax=Azospirillum picis TaxID=488438 RepID=A0ABU0MFY9_9PROT|nr:hydrolase [Azospirillum picis]MBP2298596.1 nicotinamidase-related amidase [Azospirillum picis]MDQ0532355.1 nicotinamidase-related amidase [Azospirillum picis]
MHLRAQESVLVVVDLQERLLPAIHGAGPVLRHAAMLLRGAAALSVPVVVTEQYPRGLGATVAEVRAELPPGTPVIEKISFSSTGEAAFNRALDDLARPQVVLCGTEAHVCVLQTALGLQEAGRSVFVVADAVSSRSPANHHTAIERLRGAGITIVTTEMVLFEWLERAGTPAFKQLIALIK